MRLSKIVRVGAVVLVAVIAGCAGGPKPTLDTLPMNLGLAVGTAEMYALTTSTVKVRSASGPAASALWLHYAAASEPHPCSDGAGISVGSTIDLTNAQIPGSTDPPSTMYVTLCRGKTLPANAKNPNPNR